MTGQDDEIAALKARLAAMEAHAKSSAPLTQSGMSLPALIGRGLLLLAAVCCGLLIIGAAQARVPENEVTFNIVLAVIVAFVGVVCAWLAFRKPRA